MSITALPKPTREDRKRVTIDTSELALSKRHFERDAEYRTWIAKAHHRCLLHNLDVRCGTIGDRAPIEAAHLEHGGKGVKGSDASCVHLCPVHHDRLDAEALTYQVIAFLWKHAWALREEWHRRIGKDSK